MWPALIIRYCFVCYDDDSAGICASALQPVKSSSRAWAKSIRALRPEVSVTTLLFDNVTTVGRGPILVDPGNCRSTLAKLFKRFLHTATVRPLTFFKQTSPSSAPQGA